MSSQLYLIEHVAHFTGWILACLCSLHKLFVTQTDIIKSNQYLEYSLSDLKPGWSVISRLKDESDIEWNSWKYLICTLWSYLLVQFVISEIIRTTNTFLLKYWFILSSLLYITFYMGIIHLFTLIIQPLLYLLLLHFGGKRASIWLLSIFFLAGYNVLKVYFWDVFDFENQQDEEMIIMMYAFGWTTLRCISYSLDRIDEKESLKGIESESSQISIRVDVINMLSYALYLPLLFIGPVVMYDQFKKSFDADNIPVLIRLKAFVKDMMLYQVYSFLLELSLHYIYFYAMQSDMEAMYKLSTVGIWGAGLWMGLEFHMKYVISYGTTGAYSRLDNVEPPPTPRCIARIHVYSHMWRYFDVGLYKFLVKYIYKPVYSRLAFVTKLKKKMLSSLVTFIFIFMWHGTTWDIFIWSSLNYLGILMEYLGKHVASTENYQWFKEKVLRSDAMETRLIAALCVPLLMLSAISNTYLFAGDEVGHLFFRTLTIASLYEWSLIYISFYCCCQCSIALQNVSSRTDRKIEKTV